MRALAITLFLLATPALADVAGVASVIDGDTIEVHGQRVRLHGIDAPESRQLCRLDGKPWQCGKDAANALADKIARRPVTCEDLGRDRYKRVIARCTVASDRYRHHARSTCPSTSALAPTTDRRQRCQGQPVVTRSRS